MKGVGLVLCAGLVVACEGPEPSCTDPLEWSDPPVGWSSRASLELPRASSAAVALGCRVYLVGGVGDPRLETALTDRVDVYSPARDAWSEAAPLPDLVDGANVGAFDGRLFVLGGSGSSAVWAYDPANDRWDTGLAPRPGGELQHGEAAVGVVDGRLWVAGGTYLGLPTTEVRAYDPASDTWETDLPPLPEARSRALAAVIDGVFHVVGGTADPGGGLADTVYAFDPAEGAWSERAPMPDVGVAWAGAAVDGRIVIVGGLSTAPTRTAPTHMYDPVLDAWSEDEVMPTLRYGTSAAAVGRALYVAGGFDLKVQRLTTHEAFVPEW